MDIVYPVVLTVPENAKRMKGREKVAFLSWHARKAVELSAGRAGVHLKSLAKSDHGVPLPFQGNFWSLTHKTIYVAGVVAPKEVGIDIERIKPVSEGLFEKTAYDSEWNIGANPRCPDLFFRFWTAKEAVLKATGVGIAGLLKCEVIEIPDTTHLILYHQNRFWHVEHCFFDGHVATVVQNDFRLKWVIHPGCNPC
ncbi:MAG: 4'-phosphopantetheinyl transferase superfamily protein [Desulfobacterales bacterium]